MINDYVIAQGQTLKTDLQKLIRISNHICSFFSDNFFSLRSIIHHCDAMEASIKIEFSPPIHHMLEEIKIANFK